MSYQIGDPVLVFGFICNSTYTRGKRAIVIEIVNETDEIIVEFEDRIRSEVHPNQCRKDRK